MTPEEFTALDPAAQQAVVFAVLVRNGVEDLHADGAFDDSQAPALNRLVRQELFQAFASARTGGPSHDNYLVELSEELGDEAEDDFRMRCLMGAAARAIWAFADAENVDDETARDLVTAAQAAVCNDAELQAMMTPLGSQFFAGCIAAWEPPELSDVYRRNVGLTAH